jgi:hypothetical protein
VIPCRQRRQTRRAQKTVLGLIPTAKSEQF